MANPAALRADVLAKTAVWLNAWNERAAPARRIAVDRVDYDAATKTLHIHTVGPAPAVCVPLLQAHGSNTLGEILDVCLRHAHTDFLDAVCLHDVTAAPPPEPVVVEAPPSVKLEPELAPEPQPEPEPVATAANCGACAAAAPVASNAGVLARNCACGAAPLPRKAFEKPAAATVRPNLGLLRANAGFARMHLGK